VERDQDKIQKQLDEALEDSFPASDPVSIVTSNEEDDWGDPKPAKTQRRASELRAPSAPASNQPGSPS
jgi:hypothetical protein